MSALFGLLGHALLIMAIMLKLLQTRRWKRYWPIPYLLAAVVVVLPANHWLVLEFSRGYLSDLSMATVLICVTAIMNQVRPQPVKLSNGFYLALLALGVVLYPATMGMSMNDPFVLGYSTAHYYWLFVVAVVAFGLVAWWRQIYLLATYFMLALLANGLDIYSSGNLWLYLIDPIAMIIAIWVLVARMIYFCYMAAKTKWFSDKHEVQVNTHA